METLHLITFIVAASGVILLPGPNVLIIVSISLVHGKKSGLHTVAGTSSAMAIQLAVTAIGTTWLVETLTDGFTWLRWLGVVYLIYMGITHLRGAFERPKSAPLSTTAPGSFFRGFAVSLINPKTLVFFTAFLPQFVAPEKPYIEQIMILSGIFLVLAATFDSLYAILAGRLRNLRILQQLNPVRHAVSGLLFLGGGLWLALLRRISVQ